jgi:hypothetical protein
LGGKIEQKQLHPWYLATPLWPWCTMGKEAKTNLNEGLGKVSPHICVLSYEQLSSSDPWWYILQALSPLVYYYYRILSSARVVKWNLREIFKILVCYGMWRRSMLSQFGRNLGSQIYWSWMLKKVTKSSPQKPLDRAKHPIFSSFTIHGILVRLPEKQTKLNKIPEPDVSVPYLLKLSEGYGLALLLRA